MAPDVLNDGEWIPSTASWLLGTEDWQAGRVRLPRYGPSDAVIKDVR